MAIGTAIFAIFLIWLFVHNPGFRKFVLSAFVLFCIIAVIVAINASIPERTRPIYFGERPHAAMNSDAIYRQTAPAPTLQATATQPAAPAPKPTANSELVNSILYGPSSNAPVRNTFVAGDEHHCPSDYAWDWQNKLCRLETSFRAYGPDGNSQ